MGLNEWRQKITTKKQKVIVLTDALFCGHWRQYFLYRLKFFIANLLLKHALHLVEMLFLFIVFQHNNLRFLISLSLILGIISQFWWGMLEPYREKIRELKEEGQLPFLNFYRKHMLSKSIVFALIFCAALTTATLTISRQLSLLDQLYLFAIIYRFGLGIALTTYHSSIYSFSRISRPLKSFVLVELFSFVCIIFSYPFLKAYSLPLGIILATTVSSAIKAFYIKQTIKLTIADTKVKKRYEIDSSWHKTLIAGFANSSMKLDSIFILGLFHLQPEFTFSHQINEFMMWVLILPLVHASFDWVRLMYFDLIKLGRSIFSSFLPTVTDKLIRLSISISALLFILCVLTIEMTNFQKKTLSFEYMVFIYLFCKGILAVFQLSFYIYGHYRKVILSSSISFLSVIILTKMPFATSMKISIISLINLAMCWQLWKSYKNLDILKKSNNTLLELLSFMKQHTQDHLRYGSFEFQKNMLDDQQLTTREWSIKKTWLHYRMIGKLNKFMRDHGCVAYVSVGKCIWVSKVNISKQKILQITEGSASHLKDFTDQTSFLNEAGILIQQQQQDKKATLHCDIFFKETIPNGKIVDAQSGTYLLDHNPRDEIIASKISYYFKHLNYKIKNNLQVDGLFTNNGLERIYIYPRKSKGKKTWEKEILKQNLLHARF